VSALDVLGGFVMSSLVVVRLGSSRVLLYPPVEGVPMTIPAHAAVSIVHSLWSRARNLVAVRILGKAARETDRIR
jgi:hypothetical protein